MKEFVLTAKEIIYICALHGAKEVAGVEDVFLSVPAESLVREVERIKNSLIEKGCLDMDFDGNYSSTQDTDALVDMITRSDIRIAFFSENDGNRKYGMIYVKDDMICLSERSDELYRIKPISLQDIATYFIPLFRFAKKDADTNDAISVHAQVLAYAKEQYVGKKKTHAKKTLCDAGMDEKTAELLLSAYGGKASYLSVKLDHLVSGEVFSDGLIFITDGEIAADIGFNRESEEDVFVIRKTDSASEKELFRSILAKYRLLSSEAEDHGQP